MTADITEQIIILYSVLNSISVVFITDTIELLQDTFKCGTDGTDGCYLI